MGQNGRFCGPTRCWVGVLVAVVFLVGQQVACTDRSVGGDADAGYPDGTAPPGCEVPDQQIVISSGHGPAEVHGIDVLPDGNYLIGAAESWSGSPTAGFYVVDGVTLEMLSFTPVNQETVIGRYDVHGEAIVAVGSIGDSVTLLWLSYANGEVSEVQDSTPLCSGCVASGSLPASGDPLDASPLGLAVAVQHFGPQSEDEDEIQIFLVDREAPGTARGTARIGGTNPTLAPGHWGFVLTYTAPSGHLATRLVRTEGTLSPENELAPIPATGHSNASIRVRAETIDAVVMDTNTNPDGPPTTNLRALQLSVEGMTVNWLSFSDVLVSATDFWLSTAHTLLAVSWTDLSHESVAGSWFLTAQILGLARVCGPVRVGGDFVTPLGVQQLRTVSAPHPEGFVVIWSVAHDGDGDGLFGKIIPASP
jgi:hypothetical protein